MSDEKIDHAAEAVRVAYLADNYDRADHFTGAVGVSIGVESLVQAQIAQVHATLALVEQQRIANLIAYASHRLDHRSAVGDDLPTSLTHLLATADFQAREGLGL